MKKIICILLSVACLLSICICPSAVVSSGTVLGDCYLAVNAGYIYGYSFPGDCKPNSVYSTVAGLICWNVDYEDYHKTITFEGEYDTTYNYYEVPSSEFFAVADYYFKLEDEDRLYITQSLTDYAVAYYGGDPVLYGYNSSTDTFNLMSGGIGDSIVPEIYAVKYINAGSLELLVANVEQYYEPSDIPDKNTQPQLYRDKVFERSGFVFGLIVKKYKLMVEYSDTYCRIVSKTDITENIYDIVEQDNSYLPFLLTSYNDGAYMQIIADYLPSNSYVTDELLTKGDVYDSAYSKLSCLGNNMKVYLTSCNNVARDEKLCVEYSLYCDFPQDFNYESADVQAFGIKENGEVIPLYTSSFAYYDETIKGVTGKMSAYVNNFGVIAFVDGVVLGSLDGNTEVTAADALLALQSAVKKITPTDAMKLLGDVDFKDGITASDALLILQKAVGKKYSFFF